jgi:surfactin synthase thioesterase subunit
MSGLTGTAMSGLTGTAMSGLMGTAMNDSLTSPWFVTRPGAAPWSARIFCFPHAGGSPRAFLDWQDELKDDAEIVAICRPGREHRAAEPAPPIGDYIDGAAAAIAAAARTDHRPCYLFGHSLGALVAFEVGRKLIASGELIPHHFVASGCSAPSLLPSQRVKDIATLSGKEFAEAVGFFGGLSAEVIADDEMRGLLLPGVIADFQMAVGYRYIRGTLLDIPGTIVVGRDDPHVQEEAAGPWADEFVEPVYRHWVAGGHFYFDDRPETIIEILSQVVQADQHVELI